MSRSRAARLSSRRRASGRAASASTADTDPDPPTTAQSSSTERSSAFERVEPRRDETVQRGRKLAYVLAVARLLHERDELFDEERIAAAAFEQEARPFRRRRRRTSASRTSSAVDASSSGSRCSASELCRPGSGVQRDSSPGRVVVTRTNGRLCSRASMRSHSSSTSSLAQCRSESVSTMGPVGREAFEERECRAQRVVARAGGIDAGPRHAVGEVTRALRRRASSRRLRAAGRAPPTRGCVTSSVDPPSVSRPHAWRSASATGPKTFESPYGMHWPTRTTRRRVRASASAPISAREPALADAGVARQQTRSARGRASRPCRARARARRARRRGRGTASRSWARRRPGPRERRDRAVRVDRLVAAAQPLRPERFVLDRVARRRGTSRGRRSPRRAPRASRAAARC